MTNKHLFYTHVRIRGLSRRGSAFLKRTALLQMRYASGQNLLSITF